MHLTILIQQGDKYYGVCLQCDYCCEFGANSFKTLNPGDPNAGHKSGLVIDTKQLAELQATGSKAEAQ